jgi:hypothetical protein
MAETPIVQPATPTVTPPATPPAGETPAGERVYAGKYKTVEDLEKSYVELQKKLGGPKPPADADALKIDTTPAPKVEEIPDTADLGVVLEKAGLKQEEVAKAFGETGKLTDDQYKAIKNKYGLPRAAVDQFMAGQAAQAAVQTITQKQIRAEAATIAGSEEALTALLSTAKDFVPADEIEDINARLADPKRFKGALRDVMEFHKAGVGAGKSKPLVGGSAPRTDSGEAFRTQQEMLNSMAESKKKFGDWTKDTDLMARMAVTQKVNPKITRTW